MRYGRYGMRQTNLKDGVGLWQCHTNFSTYQQKNIIVSSVVTHLQKYTNKHRYTRRPAWPDRDGAILHSLVSIVCICRPGPGEICRLPDESTAHADWASNCEATIVKDTCYPASPVGDAPARHHGGCVLGSASDELKLLPID